MNLPDPTRSTAQLAPIRTAVWAALAAIATLASAAPVAAFEPLPRSTPAEHQVDPAAIATAVDAMDDLGFVQSLVIVRDGTVIGESHQPPYDTAPLDVRSVTKSVISTLLGIAIERGYVGDISDRLVDYLPAHLVPSDPAKRDIRLWHLLTQSAGFQWDEDAEVVAWLSSQTPAEDILNRPLAAAPGTTFNYNTAATHLLSIVLAEATGMSTLDFADDVLLGPLDITDRRWLVAGGYHNGGAGLALRTEDAAKLGVLFIDGGQWHGQQIVSRAWVNRSTFGDVHHIGSFGPFTNIEYGWLWWLDRGTDHHIYTAWGFGGQFVFCVPALKLVVTTHAPWSVDNATADQHEMAILDVIVNQILPATTDRRVLTTTGVEVPQLALIDAMVQDVMRADEIRNATVAVVRDGRLVLAHGYTLDEPEVTAIEPTALFRIGSIGKSVASAAIHQLIEGGMTGYDETAFPLEGVAPLPGTTADPWLDSVTVDNLLTHTSGLYSEDNIYRIIDLVPAATGTDPPPTVEETLSYIISHPFRFAPGSDWDYNNYGYMSLGLLLEQATGRPYVEYLQDNLFRPLGISRVRQAHRLRAELAPTEVDYDGFEGDPYRSVVDIGAAAGGLVMAAPDLAKLYWELLGDADAGGLMSPATRDAMLALPFPINQLIGYGRGWLNEDFIELAGLDFGAFTDPDDGLDVIGHGGGGSGVQNVALWRSDGTVVVLFNNVDPVTTSFPFPDIQVWPEHDLWQTVGIGTEPAPPAATEAWIPVVAATDGVGDSLWRSDVGLLNRGMLANQVRLRYYHDGLATDQELALAAGEYRTIGDVVGGLALTGSGPLRIFSAEPITVTSRTYNQATVGTFGQFLGGAAPAAGLTTGDAAVLLQLAENPAARTNLGLTNGGQRTANVTVELFDGTGTLLATLARSVPPQHTTQLGRPFFFQAGRFDVEDGYAIVTVDFGRDVFVYASVVDNGTNDPTTIPTKRAPGDAHQWVAAAAHAAGANDSQWRTDLAILNLSGSPATVLVRYRDDDAATAEETFEIGDRAQLVLTDVVDQLGAAGTGAIEISSDVAVLVGSRTYNLDSEGSFGQYIDGDTTASGAAAGEHRWLPQLQQNEGFRTNVGVFNSGAVEARVRVHLRDAAGLELAAPTRMVAPGARWQLQEPYARVAGRTDIDAGYAVVEVLTGAGVQVYASVVDNVTNDPTTVPGIE